jgi:NAD-dependent dihydropyrimidine dehydrogenase PreA subunit
MVAASLSVTSGRFWVKIGSSLIDFELASKENAVSVRARPERAGLATRLEVLAEAQVVPDAHRCVQCGICSHNCPAGIDVRGHAHRGLPVHDSHCLTCAECVTHCPRGVLRFERLPLFAGGEGFG